MIVSLGAVNKILKESKETGNVEIRRKEKCGRKKTTKSDDAKLLRDSRGNARKTSEELKRDQDEISSSTIRQRLLAQGRKARRPKRKQLITTGMKKKRHNWAKKYKDWSEDDWSRILFSNKTHFFVQGFNAKFVGCSEKLRKKHFIQTVKRTQTKRCFWDAFLLMDQAPSYRSRGCLTARYTCL